MSGTLEGRVEAAPPTARHVGKVAQEAGQWSLAVAGTTAGRSRKGNWPSRERVGPSGHFSEGPGNGVPFPERPGATWGELHTNKYFVAVRVPRIAPAHHRRSSRVGNDRLDPLQQHDRVTGVLQPLHDAPNEGGQYRPPPTRSPDSPPIALIGTSSHVHVLGERHEPQRQSVAMPRLLAGGPQQA